MSDFPSGKFQRTGILAKTGLKIGGNYAKYHLKKVLGSEADKEEVHRQSANDLFKELTRLRGTALKMAQSLSMDQSGLIPDAYAEIMTGAQYKVPPINRAVVRTIVKQELGEWPEKLFAEFEPDAMAAASIGQVHRAVSSDGQKLAVKIQYPNVKETIKSDLGVARVIFEKVMGRENMEEYFDEIYTKLLEETDYINEGRQLRSFSERFNTDRYAIPEWIESMSSNKVLSMGFLEGRHLDRFLAANPSQEERNHFGQLLWDFFHEQIQNDHTIHADTHPGNFLFMDDGRLGVIDFGCVKTFPKDFFDNYLRAMPLHIEDNMDKLMQLYRELDIYRDNARDLKEQDAFVNFTRHFGQTFAEPYRHAQFDFRDRSFADRIQAHIHEATKFSGPKGSRHFIFASRVHMGLYTLLIRMGAVIDVRRSREVIDEYLMLA